MDSDALFACFIILCLFAGGILLMTWSIRREDEREKNARSDTRIKSNMVKERPLTDKTAREIYIKEKAGIEKTDKDRTEEKKKVPRQPAAGTKTAETKSFPRIIYNYFPLTAIGEEEPWVCRDCEVENSADHNACCLCGASRKTG